MPSSIVGGVSLRGGSSCVLMCSKAGRRHQPVAVNDDWAAAYLAPGRGESSSALSFGMKHIFCMPRCELAKMANLMKSPALPSNSPHRSAAPTPFADLASAIQALQTHSTPGRRQPPACHPQT